MGRQSLSSPLVRRSRPSSGNPFRPPSGAAASAAPGVSVAAVRGGASRRAALRPRVAAIKLVLFPLTKQQIESTTKMQAIAPAAKALQERYRERDPARLNAELQKLYQDNQVSAPSGAARAELRLRAAAAAEKAHAPPARRWRCALRLSTHAHEHSADSTSAAARPLRLTLSPAVSRRSRRSRSSSGCTARCCCSLRKTSSSSPSSGCPPSRGQWPTTLRASAG